MNTNNSGETDTAFGSNGPSSGNYRHTIREAVGSFSKRDALERAVDELEISGFDRTLFQSWRPKQRSRTGLVISIGMLPISRTIAKSHGAPSWKAILGLRGAAAAIGVPFYIGSVVGAGATAVGFGAATTIAGCTLGGGLGAGLGALLSGAITRWHVREVWEQLAEGGFVLWISLRDGDSERRALQILGNAGGRNVHVHEFQREWTLKDRPLSNVQFDPLLWWPGDTSRYP